MRIKIKGLITQGDNLILWVNRTNMNKVYYNKIQQTLKMLIIHVKFKLP